MIYTSYFKMCSKIPGGYSIYPKPPAWFIGSVAGDIVPEDDMYRKIKRNEITKKQFADYYLENILFKHKPEDLLEEYNGKIIFGWSADDTYDCRFIFTQYMNYYLGNVARELTKREIELGIRND